MKGSTFMPNYKKYDKNFKKSLINVYHGRKNQSSLCNEYEIPQTTI